MFAVVSAPAIPDHLKGYLGRFLQQTGPSLFVGKLSTRRAEELWERLAEHASSGGVTMVTSTANDAGFNIQMLNVAGFTTKEFDGIVLPVVVQDQ